MPCVTEYFEFLDSHSGTHSIIQTSDQLYSQRQAHPRSHSLTIDGSRPLRNWWDTYSEKSNRIAHWTEHHFAAPRARKNFYLCANLNVFVRQELYNTRFSVLRNSESIGLFLGYIKIMLCGSLFYELFCVQAHLYCGVVIVESIILWIIYRRFLSSSWWLLLRTVINLTTTLYFQY